MLLCNVRTRGASQWHEMIYSCSCSCSVSCLIISWNVSSKCHTLASENPLYLELNWIKLIMQPSGMATCVYPASSVLLDYLILLLNLQQYRVTTWCSFTTHFVLGISIQSILYKVFYSEYFIQSILYRLTEYSIQSILYRIINTLINMN